MSNERVIRIRQATWADATAIRDLHQRSMRALSAPHYTPDQIGAFTDDLEPEKYDGIGKGEMFVAESGGEVVGFGHTSGSEIEALFVDRTTSNEGSDGCCSMKG